MKRRAFLRAAAFGTLLLPQTILAHQTVQPGDVVTVQNTEELRKLARRYRDWSIHTGSIRSIDNLAAPGRQFFGIDCLSSDLTQSEVRAIKAFAVQNKAVVAVVVPLLS